MEDLRYILGQDLGILSPLAGSICNSFYVCQNIRDFIDNNEKIKPTKILLPIKSAKKFNGLALIGFRNQLRINMGDEEPYLGDLSGFFPVSLKEIVSNSGFTHRLPNDYSEFLSLNVTTAIDNAVALYRPGSKFLHLAGYKVSDGEQRERFSGSSFDLPDEIGYT